MLWSLCCGTTPNLPCVDLVQANFSHFALASTFLFWVLFPILFAATGHVAAINFS
jgi:hypothetical protein